jgi:hypothetical protein
MEIDNYIGALYYLSHSCFVHKTETGFVATTEEKKTSKKWPEGTKLILTHLKINETSHFAKANFVFGPMYLVMLNDVDVSEIIDWLK